MMMMRSIEKVSKENVDDWGTGGSASCSSNVDVSSGSWFSDEPVGRRVHRFDRRRSSRRIHCPDGVPSVVYDSSKNKRTMINSHMSNPAITKLGKRKLKVNRPDEKGLTESVQAIAPPRSEKNCLGPARLKGRQSTVQQYFPAN